MTQKNNSMLRGPERSPEREFVFRSQDPYAHIAVFGDKEEELGSIAARTSNYIANLQNPYASLSIYDQPDDAFSPARQQSRMPLFQPPLLPSSQDAKKRSNGISKKHFSFGCRKILLQYEPMNSGRGRIRPEFSAFITDNLDKSNVSRAAILNELSRFNLEGLQPYLNRERADEVVSKLKSISTAYPT